MNESSSTAAAAAAVAIDSSKAAGGSGEVGGDAGKRKTEERGKEGRAETEEHREKVDGSGK